MDLGALGLPHTVLERIGPSAPPQARMAAARGMLPLPADQQLAVLFAMASGGDERLGVEARSAFRLMPLKQVLQGISIQTHPKVLEALIEFREPDPELDERIGMLRTANDRTVRLIARRAHADLCDQLASNHERMLVTPDVFIDLHANENCSEVVLNRIESFLQMQRCLPKVPEVRPFLLTEGQAQGAPAQAQEKAKTKAMDLEAEIMAALSGKQSPALLKAQESSLEMFDLDAVSTGNDAALGAFAFDLQESMDDFGWELTGEMDDKGTDEHVRISIENQIREMTVGKKIKLAYKGNKEVRKLLIRDSNKIVASAVVRSGRLSDGEVAAFAGNKNLDREVIRELAANGEYARKYPVKVALVNNPKTPVSLAVGLVKGLQKNDLMMLTRNRNVPSVVGQAANRLYKAKYQK